MQEKIPNAKSENAVRSQNFRLSFSLSAKAERKAERKAETPPLGRDRFSLWRPRPARLSAYSWAVSAYRWPKHQNTMAMKSAISISSKWKCGPKNYFGQNRVAQRLFAGGGGGLGLPRRVSGLDARTPAGSVWVETGFSPGRSCASRGQHARRISSEAERSSWSSKSRCRASVLLGASPPCWVGAAHGCLGGHYAELFFYE